MTTKEKKTLELPDFITVRELATMMETSPITIIKELMTSGIMANINQQIDFDTASLVADELGFEVVEFREEVDEDEDDGTQPEWRKVLANESKRSLEIRPPVITMLGHVDHGKTSLLDVIRSANVQAGEAGGITQHIGAYQITYEGKSITFLDTPGHAAFTAMRARGARSTDIAILVVAADDGIMPQTREAADHARAAKVPIIVALNKMDVEGANPARVKQQLAEIGLTPDEWQGDTLVIPVSAKTQEGMEDLLEAILLTAEEIEPKANPKSDASGTVIEARMEKGQGVLTTLLVQNGTLRVGDSLLIGEHYGRVRTMQDENGKRRKNAPPSTPISVTGLSGVPNAGDQFRVVENDKVARKMAEDHANQLRQGRLQQRASVSLDAFFSQLVEGESKTLNVIVKADVQGSLEPVVASLNKLPNEEVSLDILLAATGAISESDVMLASASGAVILGFNVGVDSAANMAAKSDGVEIKTYAIIYKLLEDVERAMKGMMDPVYEEVIIGRAEVRVPFSIKGIGKIAGSFLRTGVARRNASARLIRGTDIIYTGTVSSLKRHQDNVNEVRSGFEFGVGLTGWSDILENDVVEFFVTQKKEIK
jgi:translation initiation factor IF-2